MAASVVVASTLLGSALGVHAIGKIPSIARLGSPWAQERRGRSSCQASSFWGRQDRQRLTRPRDCPKVEEKHVARRRATVAVRKESQMIELGTRCPDFSLKEPLTGETVSLSDFEGAPAFLVMFMCNHCPFVVHLKDAIVTLTNEYTNKGLAVVAINSNSIATHPQDGPEAMAEEAKKLGYAFPFLFDETQEVAQAFKAACTPEFYLFKKDGRRPFELVYRGQFDDSRPGSGKPVTGKDLRDAIEYTLSGRPVPPEQKPSIGCNIKWAPGKEPAYF